MPQASNERVGYITTAATTTLGAATYDEAGGTVDDVWTLAAHGLAVGDHVRFSAVGTGATGYAVDTDYWVAAVPGATEFTLAATSGGAAIAGTGDSVGIWTLTGDTAYRLNLEIGRASCRERV